MNSPENTEPAPLTQREMNQFIMLAALPTLERALERLRWLEAQNADLKERIDKAYEDIALDQRTNETLRAENAALKKADPLAEMWRELAEYQPQAERDGHGESWRKMCEERTKESARDAADAAFAVAVPAKDKLAHVAALEAGFSARNAAWAEMAQSKSVKAAAEEATDAISAIRRAKEGQ